MSENSYSGHYEKQDRGTQAAYEAYFAGMDSSMQQKVALTTAHFPVRGRIADMGSGSGRGTYDLASLYQGLELIGVDINPVSVERASSRFQRANLSYGVGDISEMVFPAQSLDGILDSSVLHHVTSFNDFDVSRVLVTLDNQVDQLKPGGVIIIRDFVIPDGPENVHLDLPETDGSESGSITELSTAAVFELFAQNWRSSLNRKGPVPFSRIESPRSGYVRYELGLRTAAEFVLRKDYRADWETEILEEYTYLTQSQFEQAFRSRGLRIVTSRPLWNPWIVQNRFENKFYLSDLNGSTLPFPPTNYLIVGEKISAGEGVELIEQNSRPLSTSKFLRLSAYRLKESQRTYELVERPNQTIDVLPWFESNGQLFVFAKKDFPRPIVNAGRDQTRLNHNSLSGYITEPISAIVDSSADLGKSVANVLMQRASFAGEDILEVGEPFYYYTSPGGINERVKACPVQVRPRLSVSAPFPNYTQFKDAGTVRELDAIQVLRACHVGGMFDARIEINIYHLLRALGRKAGPWIGAPVKLSLQSAELPPMTNECLLSPYALAAFEQCPPHDESDFLVIKEGVFAEQAHDGSVLAQVPFEYVLPRNLSLSTVVALPVAKTNSGTFIGIQLRNLPAVQAFSGSSKIATAPAWRLPRAMEHWTELPGFLGEAMRRDFNLRIRHVWEMGGSYMPSPGVTPEIVYPFVAEVEATEITGSSLHFIELNNLKNRIDAIQEGHLLITACRLIHSLD
ncbi:MAG: class I SAM-dependent methyltransferase [Pyrinomonadaceae bacterium]